MDNIDRYLSYINQGYEFIGITTAEEEEKHPIKPLECKVVSPDGKHQVYFNFNNSEIFDSRLNGKMKPKR